MQLLFTKNKKCVNSSNFRCIVSFPPRNVQVPKGKSPMKASNSSTDFPADDTYDIQGTIIKKY